MQLVVIHYHLEPGGVTRVIAGQLAALGDVFERVLVLHGGADDGWQATGAASGRARE